MKGERDEAARRTVLEQLAGGASVSAAAKAAGVARQTPYQWADRGDEEMREALASSKRRGRPGGDGPGAPRAAPPPPRRKPNADEALALETLRSVARGERDGEDSSPSAHVQAAKALLDYHRKLRQDLTPTTAATPSAPVAVAGPEDDEDLGALITRITG